MKKKRKRMPTKAQWKTLWHHIGNSYGDGTYFDGRKEEEAHFVRAMAAFEDWFEDRYRVQIVHRLTTRK